MTNELAIRILTGDVLGTAEQNQETITMAVKALSLPSAQPELAQDLHNACTDAISRQAAIEVVDAVWSVTGDKNVAKVWDQIKDLPSAQPDDWMERNKERILQAGMEGREIEFRIGGRLFAIREKAQ